MQNCPTVNSPEEQQALWLQGFGSGLVPLPSGKSDTSPKRLSPREFAEQYLCVPPGFDADASVGSDGFLQFKYSRRRYDADDYDFQVTAYRSAVGLKEADVERDLKVIGVVTGRTSCSGPNFKDVEVKPGGLEPKPERLNVDFSELERRALRYGAAWRAPGESPTGRTIIPEPEVQTIKCGNGSTIKALPMPEGAKLRGERPTWLAWVDAEKVADVIAKYGNRSTQNLVDGDDMGICRVCRKRVHSYSVVWTTEGFACVEHEGELPKPAKVRVMSSYLKECLAGTDLQRTVFACVEALKGRDFDAIAYRGNSGALVAPAVAAILGKHVIMVRKTDGPDKQHHSAHGVEGVADTVRYVIIDDFISSGHTLGIIVKEIRQELNRNSTCVGIVEYTKLPFNKDRSNYDLWEPNENNVSGKTELYRVPVFSIELNAQAV